MQRVREEGVLSALHYQRDFRVQAHACPGFDPAADSLRRVPVAQFRHAAVRRYSRRQPVLCFREIAGRGRLSHRESPGTPVSNQVPAALSAAAVDRLARESALFRRTCPWRVGSPGWLCP